ncbi:unnamed protein product [Dicrocoelium dendriticum]|nr:unnamed protein product [Dicrocoelium dendriticum]
MPNSTYFLMCDVQEKLVPTVLGSSEFCHRVQQLISLSKEMGIPLIVTEQYPKGLGKTVSSLDVSHAVILAEKTAFSMLVDSVLAALPDPRTTAIVLFGLETHICVLQTAVELLERGFTVHLVADACSSRSQVDMQFALRRISNAGAVLTTTEALLFELVKSKDSVHFPLLRQLCATRIPDHPALAAGSHSPL